MSGRNKDKTRKSYFKIMHQYPDCNLRKMELDIESKSSIQRFAKKYEKNFKQVDFLVNNAAVGYPEDVFGKDIAKKEVHYSTFRTNTKGTVIFSETMRKLLSNDGRIISISS